MEKHPNEMLTEEVNAIYGEPVRQPMITAVISSASNLSNHDIITLDCVTEKNTHIEIPITQEALKTLVRLTEHDTRSADRPKAH